MVRNFDFCFTSRLGLLCILLFVLAFAVMSCTTNHYFSVNADEMTNPKIEYHDSTSVTNPF